MLQPFEHFNEAYIDRLIQLKKYYLVTQTYTRGLNHFAEAYKTDILITDYETTGPAQMHLNAVKADKYGSIIDLTKPEHKKKLIEMLSGEQYELYWSILRSKEDLQKRLEEGYKDKMRKYIQLNTDWRIGGDEALNTQAEVVFGELFITLKWRSKKQRIKFEEIERY